MAYAGYINPDVAKMYGIPYSQLTAEQKKILHEDSLRRAKLINERQQEVMKNGLKAFDDEAKMERVLASLYRDCQKQILADVTETISKVQKAGGVWSYANQSALTRSRGLFEQITQELTKLGQKETGVFYKGLENIYTDQYLRQMFTLGQFTEVKANLNRLNPALIRKTLDYPWSGAMFSDRIWNDKEKLGRNLRLGLTQSMILGEGIPAITERVRKNIETSKYNAERVARTETKRVTYCAHNDIYEDIGIDELEYRCANGGDSRTCDLCRDDNGKHFKRGEEPTLPRHPNCRCIYIPVVADTFKPGELNDLTGSIRGAENYEKWMQENADKLNPDGSLKDGWVRDWENGGKLVYKGDKPLPEPSLNNGGKSDKVIKLEGERQALQMELDGKNDEYKKVAEKYQSQVDDLTVKTDLLTNRMKEKQDEMSQIAADRAKIFSQQRALRVDHEAQKISDEEYDKLVEACIKERQRLLDAYDRASAEYSDILNNWTAEKQKLNAILLQIDRDRRQINLDIAAIQKRMENIDKRLITIAKYPTGSDAFLGVIEQIEGYQVTERAVKPLLDVLSEDEIIDKLAGGDLTTGSCSSLAFSYIGNKNGFDVTDYRGGQSQKCFSQNAVIKQISKLPGVKSEIIMVKKEAADTVKILQGLEIDKEYYLAVGKHAAIVRNTDHGLEYLEMQSGRRNGWTSFKNYGTMVDTLAKRFGCRKTVDKMKIGDQTTIFEKSVVLMDVASFNGNTEFVNILGYMNTAPDKQKKGALGSVK